MRKAILDTDILSEYLKGHDVTVARNKPVSQSDGVAEPQRRNCAASRRFSMGCLGKASAQKLGFIVELPDCLIAAAAVRLSLPLVTGNTADYDSICKTGVELEIKNWRLG
jgi:hypothetical protein